MNRHLLQFVRFSIIGLIGFVIDFGTYTLLTRVFGTAELPANITSVFLAIIFNFIGNRYWVFSLRGNSGLTGQTIKYAIVSGAGYIVQQLIFILLLRSNGFADLVPFFTDYAAKIVAILIVMFNNYFANKFWTFRVKEEKNEQE
ncbi:MAG: GtrA family protein [bacterium]